MRGDGDRLQVSTGAARAGVLEALKLATERYGDRITVNGTSEFKAQAIRAAVDGKLAIRFLTQLWRSAARRYCKTISV